MSEANEITVLAVTALGLDPESAGFKDNTGAYLLEILHRHTRSGNALSIVREGSIWMHRNGNTYVVTALANLPGDNDAYPIHVIYQNVNTLDGRLFSRQLVDWARSMIYVQGPKKETEATTISDYQVGKPFFSRRGS